MKRIRHDNNFHPCGFAGNHAIHLILEYETLDRIAAEAMRTREENGRVRLTELHSIGGSDAIEIMSYIKMLNKRIDHPGG